MANSLSLFHKVMFLTSKKEIKNMRFSLIITRSFKSYRITFPKLADIYAKEMQIAEIELLKADTVSNDPLLEEAKKLHIEMTEGRKSLLTTTLVARELPEQRKRVTQILNRGEYNQPIGDPLVTWCIFCSWSNAQKCTCQSHGTRLIG